jgi:hypothetical protein
MSNDIDPFAICNDMSAAADIIVEALADHDDKTLRAVAMAFGTVRAGGSSRARAKSLRRFGKRVAAGLNAHVTAREGNVIAESEIGPRCVERLRETGEEFTSNELARYLNATFTASTGRPFRGYQVKDALMAMLDDDPSTPIANRRYRVDGEWYRRWTAI